MGTRAPSLTDIALEFDEDSELHGAVIRCKAIPINRIGEFDELDLEQFVQALVDEIVISWDLEDVSGTALPLTAEALGELPPWVPMAIRNSWNRGLLTPPKRH